MNETSIACPKCGNEFAVAEALSAKARTEMEANLSAEHTKRLKAAVHQAETRARETLGLELKDLREQLGEQRRKAETAENREIAMRKKSRELEDKQKTLDLEIDRRVDEARKKIEKQVREQVDAVQDLKIKEKERQIEDLREALEDVTRKSRQGSVERQGETLELDIEAGLTNRFPEDAIRPVPKGMRGADLFQDVCNGEGRMCGAILWELKNTKTFQQSWIDKLKQDQRSSGAALAVIVTATMPSGVREFARHDGVWIASLSAWPALAMALREQLVHVAFARAASEGRSEKMEMLYNYLAGEEFRHRIEAIVEAFSAMHGQIQKERRAMERLWCEREKQIERVVTSTAGMYGSVRGLIGGGMPEIELLTLEAAAVEGELEQ